MDKYDKGFPFTQEWSYEELNISEVELFDSVSLTDLLITI